jgi:hypothetical protein
MSLTQKIQDWEDGRNWFQFSALNTHLNKTQNLHIPAGTIQRELKWLEETGQLERKQELYKLCEYDPPEQTLYDKLEVLFRSEEFVGKQLSVKAKTFVLQNTSKGGAPGEGRLTRPDFTLATLRRWRFDPAATLDVYSFEVKNRAGSSAAAVYEALAHGRYVNYPYLVCPNSRFDESLNRALKSTCEREGVGLVQFDIRVATQQKDYSVTNVILHVQAERRATDPSETERFLVSRFNEENKLRLEQLASSVRT